MRILALALLTPVLLLVLVLLPPRPALVLPAEHFESKPDESFESFVAKKIERAHAEGVLPGNEERAILYKKDGKTPIALLFIHGFGAARADGEAFVESLSEAYGANAYLMRLPGHGGGMEAHAAAKPEEYFSSVEEAFHRARPLGEKLVLVGSSTGALFCAWLAARHPNDVEALVLASPLFAFGSKMSFLLSRRAGMTVIEALYGPIRDASWKTDPEHRIQPGYDDHWITKQRYRALSTLDDMRRALTTDEILAAVRAPMLVFSYDADELRRDTIVSIPAIHSAFQKMNGGHPHPLSREVAIADGNHILFSLYVRTDKEKILAETRSFLSDVLGTPKR